MCGAYDLCALTSVPSRECNQPASPALCALSIRAHIARVPSSETMHQSGLPQMAHGGVCFVIRSHLVCGVDFCRGGARVLVATVRPPLMDSLTMVSSFLPYRPRELIPSCELATIGKKRPKLRMIRRVTVLQIQCFRCLRSAGSLIPSLPSQDVLWLI